MRSLAVHAGKPGSAAKRIVIGSRSGSRKDCGYRSSPGIGFHWTLIWAKFMAVRVSYAKEERYERGRWSSKKKMHAVLRLLKGEDLLSRELRVNAATLSSWREVILARGDPGERSGRPEEPRVRDEKIDQLRKALAETALNLEISKEIKPGLREEAWPFGIRASTK